MKTFRFFRTQYLPLEGAKATSLGLFCAIALWFLTLRAVLSQNSVQRDQEALTILTQTIAAGGGQELLASIRDLTETGTVTYNFADPVTGKVTVKSRGLHQFRIDADLDGGKRSTVVNGDGGSLKEADGRNWPIYRQSATDIESLTLPYLALIAAIQDASTRIIYSGLTTHNGTSVYDIRIEKVRTFEQKSVSTQGTREGHDIYIDPQSYLIMAVSDQVRFSGGGDQGVAHEILYSSYQAENGIPMPLAVSERVRGVTTLIMQLDQVTFNSGLTDSDFLQ